MSHIIATHITHTISSSNLARLTNGNKLNVQPILGNDVRLSQLEVVHQLVVDQVCDLQNNNQMPINTSSYAADNLKLSNIDT